MRKVFGIGLTRTGTLSLTRAMIELGYNAKHSPQSVNAFKILEFTADLMTCSNWRWLDYWYPEAKFILTVRDLESWLESNRVWLSRRKKSFRVTRFRFAIYETAIYNKELFIKTYYIHNNAVKQHFRDEPEKLLVLDICAGEGWDKLCKFLNVIKPNTEFPHDHKLNYRRD